MNTAYRAKLRIAREKRENERIIKSSRDSVKSESRFFYENVIKPEAERWQHIGLLLQRNKLKAKKLNLLKTSFTASNGKKAQNTDYWITEAVRQGLCNCAKCEQSLCRCYGKGTYYIELPSGKGGTVKDELSEWNGKPYSNDVTQVINPKTLEVTDVTNTQRIYVSPLELRSILMGELTFTTTVEGNREGTELTIKTGKENLTPPGERQKLPKWYTKGIKDRSLDKHKKLTDYHKGNPDYLKR